MRILGKKRSRLDKGQQSNPPRPKFRRRLSFEQMEERITLSTSTGALAITFEGANFSEGGLISFTTDQVFVSDVRGVIDSQGFSGVEFSGTLGTGPILNYQDLQTTDVDAADKGDTDFQSRGNLNASLLGGGLEQVIPIAPLEQTPPTQPDGGQVQIAQLFGPSFEQRSGIRSEAGLVESPRTESLQKATAVRDQGFDPAQGRDMAFEVASTSPPTLTNSDHDSEFNEFRGLERDASEKSSPIRQSAKTVEPREAAQVPAMRPDTHVSDHREKAPAESIPQSTMAAITQVDHRESHNPAEVAPDAARDQVFAEWEEQLPAEVEAPTAPLAKDRQQQVNPTVVLSGVAILSAGIHYARAQNRDTLKETEQLVERDE